MEPFNADEPTTKLVLVYDIDIDIPRLEDLRPPSGSSPDSPSPAGEVPGPSADDRGGDDGRRVRRRRSRSRRRQRGRGRSGAPTQTTAAPVRQTSPTPLVGELVLTGGASVGDQGPSQRAPAAPEKEAPPLDASAARPDSQDLSLAGEVVATQKRAIQGPDLRFAPGEDSAITKALRRAVQHPGHSVFYPFEVTTFNSSEEAKDFYNLYSWEIGFGIRYGRSRVNNVGYRTKQDLVCSCEKMKEQDPSMRMTFQLDDEDQCAAMAKAIRTTLSTSAHRWCRWHVLKKAKQKLGNVASKYSGFKEFARVVTDETSKLRFERTWRQIVRKYNLQGNKFMARLYKHRHKWARPYFMNIFCAGMTSTQRSESVNHMVKKLIQRAAPMHMFVSKFNELQGGRKDDKSKEVHITNQLDRKLRVGVPIERHASTIYTRAMYGKFYDELFRLSRYAIKSRNEGGTFILREARYLAKDDAPEFNVTVCGDESIKFSCGLFEHLGMLCSHCLKVLVHLDRLEIPPNNIMKRWTHDATSPNDGASHEQLPCRSVDAEDRMRKEMLLKKVLVLANADEKLTEEAFNHAMEAIVTSQKGNHQFTASVDNICTQILVTDTKVPVACPPRPSTGGRPPNTGLKSWLSSTKKKRKQMDTDQTTPTITSTDEENPRGGKTKSIMFLLNKFP
ncbi:hypothetical protein C2845_PM10G11160 [Panicum miliaceum]|uniref:Protein FAR1-RELATED SEQUENCE n=1 Tax=Panicum miliaceum TaxID=4540 RepID=A0A3L6PD37_PANMI|nr:hypothetical protein C2845_PM10G11160 [Panicum miliaceum]